MNDVFLYFLCSIGAQFWNYHNLHDFTSLLRDRADEYSTKYTRAFDNSETSIYLKIGSQV